MIAIPVKACGDDTSFASEIEQHGFIFIGGVNYSTAPADNGTAYFAGDKNVNDRYTYATYDGKNADDLTELLGKYGYRGDWYNQRYKVDTKAQK
jgi:hypothetical protein